MFENIGSKIKNLAIVFTCIGFVASFITGFTVMPFGIIYIVVGCLISWIGSMLIYGFGQLIENTDKLVNKLSPEEETAEEITHSKSSSKRENWTCISCGTENAGHIPYCNSCGVSRDWSESKRQE